VPAIEGDEVVRRRLFTVFGFWATPAGLATIVRASASRVVNVSCGGGFVAALESAGAELSGPRRS
jgi:hypothetical protein